MTLSLDRIIRGSARRVRSKLLLLAGLFRPPTKLFRSAMYQAYGYRLLNAQFPGLHLGCGPMIIPQFLNIDAGVRPPADLLARVDRLKLNARSVGVIYCSHVLEHITRSRYQRTLAEWYRVLKPGGRIYIAVPDLEKLFRLYLDNLQNYDTSSGKHRVDQSVAIVYGGQTDRHDFHYYGYSFTTLKALLEGVGFDTVERFEREALPFAQEFHDGGYAELDGVRISLNVVATK